MLLEPFDRLIVERLVARGIGDQRQPDMAKAPYDERRKGDARGDSQRHGDGERQQRRHSRLEPALQWPDDRDDEQRQRQRREHLARLIGGGGRQDRGDDSSRHVERRIARHAEVPGLRPAHERKRGGSCPNGAAMYSRRRTSASPDEARDGRSSAAPFAPWGAQDAWARSRRASAPSCGCRRSPRESQTWTMVMSRK